ncbi:Iron-regulated ABC transporter permease protein SufD [Acidothermus cellulolyticus 11B]|uniref:Iron-regulated ABC transporter permease protein SufD n=2 Tax=Acidothermus cellulolyticus TaxID=28049 RepID=A0LTZ8_ACIC1|nr:Iron-regulated ABC transporter permease protein SufD [Acidothermus cellulolyticus 11B]
MTERTNMLETAELSELERGRIDVDDAPVHPQPHSHGLQGGRHLERTFSFDPADFPEPDSHQELWRFAALPRLRPLFAGPPATGTVDVSWPDAAPVQTVPMTDPRLDVVHTPFDRISAVARQRVTEALVVDIGDTAAEPVTLAAKGTGGVSYGHLLVTTRPGSAGTVVLDHRGSGTYAANVELDVADGSSLTFVTIQDWDDDAIHVAAHSARIGRDARLRHINVSFGGSAVRISPLVTFAAPGGDAELLGVFFADAGQHIDARLMVDHSAPNCRSRVNYRGALQGEKARTVWVGDVIIRPQAVGTDTYEANRNLLLTDGARADSVPNLEILTGEVIGAGHASATGRLDDEQLFYLQARGIPRDQARRLIVRGFFADVIEDIGIPELVTRLLAHVDRELELTELTAVNR